MSALKPTKVVAEFVDEDGTIHRSTYGPASKDGTCTMTRSRLVIDGGGFRWAFGTSYCTVFHPCPDLRAEVVA